MRKNCFSGRVVRQWNRLHWEVVELSSLEVKAQMDTVCGHGGSGMALDSVILGLSPP